jgi:hypothetical protein
MEVEGCPWSVRAFYEINSLLPSSEEGIGGSGVYGLSEAGRTRFDVFPDVISDDGFVRIQFAPHERLTVRDCHSTVFAPKTFRELVRIKTRSHLGCLQLQKLYPHLWSNIGQSNWPTLTRLSLQPLLWSKLFVYGLVKGIARVRARRMFARGQFVWERADSSRG